MITNKDNAMTIRVVYKGQTYAYEIGLREDILHRDLPQVEHYLLEVAQVCTRGLIREIEGYNHETYSIEIRTKREKARLSRVVGNVIIGPPRAQGANSNLQLLVGKRIFFRTFPFEADFIDHEANVLECDTPAWKAAHEQYAVEYMVTFAEDTGHLFIAHANNVGLPARVHLGQCIMLKAEDGVGAGSFTIPPQRERRIVESEGR